MDLHCEWIQFNCPQCEFPNEVTLKQVEAGEAIICGGCLSEIRLVDEGGSTRQSLQAVEQSLDELTRALRDLER